MSSCHGLLCQTVAPIITVAIAIATPALAQRGAMLISSSFARANASNSANPIDGKYKYRSWMKSPIGNNDRFMTGASGNSIQTAENATTGERDFHHTAAKPPRAINTPSNGARKNLQLTWV